MRNQRGRWYAYRTAQLFVPFTHNADRDTLAIPTNTNLILSLLSSCLCLLVRVFDARPQYASIQTGALMLIEVIVVHIAICISAVGIAFFAVALFQTIRFGGDGFAHQAHAISHAEITA